MRFVFALLLLSLGAPVQAQSDVTVTSSTPADHSVGVPLTTTLTFTFDAPVAGSPQVFFSPREALVVGEPVLAPDGRSVAYAVEHQPDTRYVHLVLGATGANGETLARPFALNYTTSASAGPFTVTGEVHSASFPDGIIAALGTLDPDTGSLVLVYADVITNIDGPPSRSYTLGPVPLGLYFAGAVHLPDADTPFAYGFYDPDDDGIPDPVVLPFNVDIEIETPEPVTAGARVNEAVAAALDEAADNDLVLIPTTPVDTLGTAPLWAFRFYSAAQSTETTVLATGFLPLPITQEAPDGPAALATIGLPFADTDVAVQAAEHAGGRAFRQGHAGAVVVLTIRGGLLDDFAAPDPFWRVQYRALESEGGPALDSLGVFVDMVTGQVLGTTTARTPDAPGATSARVRTPFPNPFHQVVHTDVTLDAPAAVRASVVDLLGRELAVLADAVLPAGVVPLRWEPGPGVPAGVYLLRVQAGERRAVHRLVYRP